MQHRRLLRHALVAAGAAGALALGTALPAAAAGAQVALWNMGDSGGTMHDSTGHGHDGTLHDVTTGVAGYTASGKAFGFSADPAFVTVPSATPLNPGTSSFSFTLHLKYPARPSASVEDFDVLRKGLGTSEGGSYKLEILQSGTAFCDFRGSTADGFASSSSALSTGKWHTVTCSRTPSTITVTVDGSSHTKSVSTGTISNTGSLTIGARSTSGGDQYRGTIDAVSISKG